MKSKVVAFCITEINLEIYQVQDGSEARCNVQSHTRRTTGINLTGFHTQPQINLTNTHPKTRLIISERVPVHIAHNNRLDVEISF